ncbi:MAG: hypothetical protein J6T34_03725 [Bacilli bacterium]|nr:hypothetical protein [Bacilli bacterium]
MQEKDYNENLIEDTSKEEAEVNTSKEVVEGAPKVETKESIEEEVQEETLDSSSEDDYNQLANETDTKVKELLDKLDLDIEKYNKAHSDEAEEKKILNSRNLVLRLKKGQIDKVINEAKASIASLEKECFDKINHLEAEIVKLEKEYNSVVNEAEKKAKAEVRKIDDAILAPKIKDEEEPIDLITATDEEIDARHLIEEQKIYDLRLDGITNIANLKREYYTTKYESEKNYVLKKLELKREIETLKNKEDEEVANLRHIIKEESARLRDEEYFTNHNAMLNIAATKYKNKVYIEKLKEKTYAAINNLYLENDKEENTILIHKEWYLVKTSEVDSAKKLAKKEYLDCIDSLNQEKNDYANTYTKGYLVEVNDFKKTMAVIKRKPKLINDKYDNLVESETKGIDTEYKNHIKHIEQEEQTKKLMCKKTNNS